MWCCHTISRLPLKHSCMTMKNCCGSQDWIHPKLNYVFTVKKLFFTGPLKNLLLGETLYVFPYMNSTGQCKYDLSTDNYSQSATPLQLVLLSVSEVSLQIQFLWEVPHYLIFLHHFVVIKKQFGKLSVPPALGNI